VIAVAEASVGARRWIVMCVGGVQTRQVYMAVIASRPYACASRRRRKGDRANRSGVKIKLNKNSYTIYPS
jgi:hypothetical protein